MYRQVVKTCLAKKRPQRPRPQIMSQEDRKWPGYRRKEAEKTSNLTYMYVNVMKTHSSVFIISFGTLVKVPLLLLVRRVQKMSQLA